MELGAMHKKKCYSAHCSQQIAKDNSVLYFAVCYMGEEREFI